jgi:hypothetical protein
MPSPNKTAGTSPAMTTSHSIFLIDYANNSDLMTTGTTPGGAISSPTSI